MKPYKTITLRLNANEYAHLKQQAEATGLKMEPLLRHLVLGVQLAHQANARGEATTAEISEAARLVRQAVRLVKDTL